MARRVARMSPHRGTRVRRADATGPDRLESLSAAFALLAQRRARLMRQIDLLDRQRNAAHASLEKVEAKLGELSGHIAAQPISEAGVQLPVAAAPASPQAKRVATPPAQPVPMLKRTDAPAGDGTQQRRSRSILLTY